MSPPNYAMKLIPLTQGYFAKVSDRDYRWLRKYKWQVHKRKHSDTLYAKRRVGKSGTVLMHRQIKGFPVGLDVDHRDRDGLNNQRRNLRKATHKQNGANRKGPSNGRLKGTTRHGSGWKAQITVDGRRQYLGTCRTEQAAHELYVRAATKLHGKFMRG